MIKKGKEEKDFFKKIKLPKLSKFKATTKETNPYIKFYEYLAKELGLKSIKNMDVSSFWVTDKVSEDLKCLVTEWAKKAYKLRGKILTNSVGMLFLDIGPASFYSERPAWAEDTYVYVKKPFLAKEKTK